MKRIKELFEDKNLVLKIKNKLPQMFQIAEMESSRAGKIGMEVGSLRERIIVALLIYKFGEKNVETELPITEPEVDVKLFGDPISIKTITGKALNGVKLIWTVDAEKALQFRNNYKPHCDMILVRIHWDNEGGFYYIPLNVQLEVLNKIGINNYIKLPKPGTNPRGVEISADALQALVEHKETFKIDIIWKKEEIKYNSFQRWVKLWEQK